MPLTCLAILNLANLVLAAAPTAAKPGASIAAYLASHDVPSAAALRALSSNPEKPLSAIAADTRAEPLVRARAVAALRLFPSAETRGFLGKLVEDKAQATSATDRMLVRRAAVALGWMAGPGTCERLARLFANADAEVRVDGAVGLGLTRAPEAPALLRKQLAVETVARVRDQIERQLRALGQTPADPSPPPRKEQVPMRGGF